MAGVQPKPTLFTPSMGLQTYFAQSCAASGITNLGQHRDAVHAMRNFCSSELGVIDNAYVRKYSKLAAFYIFVAGPEVPFDHPNGSHHSKPWVRYGSDFAEYILSN